MTWDITKEPTKVLLGWLDGARKCGGSWDPNNNNEPGITIEELKEELKTREHIPNKLEAKKIRQQRAKFRY